MKIIRWGIIGCGDVTERKSGPGFQKAGGSALTAVMRRDGTKAADYAQRHRVPKWYADADQLISDGEVDAVYIATPPGQHEFYAMKVLAAKKPCYVEKPFTRNAPEAQRLVKSFAAAGVPLFVAYYRRGLERFRKARELVTTGVLGTVTSVAYRNASNQSLTAIPENLPWRLIAEQAGAGIFLDLASHTLDVLDFILGPLHNVSGRAANIAGTHAVEDLVVMHFSLANGGVGTASWNFASAISEDTIELSGTLGKLTMSCFGNEPLHLETVERGVQLYNLPNPDHVQQPLIQSMVNELLGKGPDRAKCPSTGVSALRTQIVMDAVLESYYGGREDNFWRRDWPG